MAKMLSEAVVRLMLTMLLLVSVTTAKVATVYSTDRPNFDISVQTSSNSPQDIYLDSHVEEFVKSDILYENDPVITVKLLCGNQINATQERFQFYPWVIKGYKYKWNVSLNYQTKGGKYGQVWMNETSVVFDVPLNSNDEWILFSGYFRVKYDAILWDRIIKQMNENHTVFSELSRSRLIRDAGELAEVGHLGYDTFLSLLRYASQEKGLTAWNYIYASFYFINSILSDTANFSHFQRYVLNLTSSLMDELQVNGEGDYTETCKRRTIISLACSAGHKGCIENTTRLFRAWIQNDTASSIPLYIASNVYCIGIANSLLESDWNTVFDRFTMSTSYIEKIYLLNSLTCSRNFTMLKRLLEYSTDTKVDRLYHYAIISRTATNPASKDYVWEWLKLNGAKIDERFGLEYTTAHLIDAAKNFKTREQRQEVSDFLDNYRFVVRGSKSVFLYVIDTNIRWMDKNLAAIFNWLKQNVPK